MSNIVLHASASLIAAAAFVHSTGLSAKEIDATHLLPETTVGYVEVSDPSAIMAMILDHPLSAHIQNIQSATEMTFQILWPHFMAAYVLKWI